MMNKSGCAPGYEHRGDACYLKNRVQNIPFSVNTKAGCQNFGGKWDDSYGFGGVCLVHDTMTPNLWIGWTAPIRGLYFYWLFERMDPTDVYDPDGIKELKEEGKNPRDYAYDGMAVGCYVKENKRYPDEPNPCTEAIIGEPMDGMEMLPYSKMAEHYKGYALNMARGILEKGDRDPMFGANYAYYTQSGKKLPGYRPDAIPVEASSCYGDTCAPRHTGKKPFRIH